MAWNDEAGPGTKFRFAKKDYNAVEAQDFSYYSGAQITIWFGDIWVDDIDAISWNYTQEKRPIYGYASQHLDAVAKGQVIIQGQLRVNFREKGYLSYIIQNLPKLRENLKTYEKEGTYENIWSSIKPVVALHLKQGTFGPGTLQDIQDLPKREDFFDVAKLYEEIIWGDLDKRKQKETKFKTPDIVQQEIFPKGFDIMITYGDPQAIEPQSTNDLGNSTVKSLIGVHLTGSSQVIEANGAPIQEMYTFMARDMDEYTGTAF
jgi:hypothetical protein